MTFSLARDYPDKPFNSTITRFDPRYWTVDYNAEMVGVIIPINGRSFRVPAQWRTNKDFLGVRWQSEDIYSHEYFRYGTDVNYRDTILAFRANPAEPHKFTCTITDMDFAHTYRLAPYVLDPATNRYVPLDPEYNPGRNYPASVFWPENEWTPIPLDEMEYFKGRKDYIFILDFNDLRTSANYKGPLASPLMVTQLSFDTVEWQSGLGRDATIFEMRQLRPGYMEIMIGGSIPGAKLTPGDQLQFTYKYRMPGQSYLDSTDQTLVVDSWDGFGTGTLRVRGYGSIRGSLVQCDALYSRFLQQVTPTAVTDSNKYFMDFRISGARQTIQAKHYPQPAHSIHMTSGFDDNYPQTPARQVDMVMNLGYRDFWNVYIGMSHYFAGRCGYRDSVTGEFLVMSRSQSLYTLFAGDQQMSGYAEKGYSPNRGQDTFRRELSQLFGVTAGLIEPIQGHYRASAIDRACIPEGQIDFPYWWDLEANAPGTALLAAIAAVGTNRKPHVVLWAAGTLDLEAIRYPGTRPIQPSHARSLAATEAVWRYMRSYWKEPDLRILVQNQTWAWTDAIGSIAPSTGIWLHSYRNTWGDVEFRFLSYLTDPAGKTFVVDVFDPRDPSVVMRTLGGAVNRKGWLTIDYPVEVNVPDAVETRGDQFPWEFLKWRVRCIETGSVSPPNEQFVPLDNNAFVSKVALIGINSLGGGYFNDLSDPLDHGGTGKPGRKDVVAASTFRKALAAELGIRPMEVMPVMTVIGSSPINPMPYQPGFDLENYWWDAPTNSPGPNLRIANDIVSTLGRAPDYFMESGPGETTGIVYAPPAQHAAILSAWKSSNVAMLNWMRANWGNPELKIWFQGATTSFWGNQIPPQEVNYLGAALLRAAQVDMSINQPGFMLASYVPNGGSWQSFLNEMDDGLGWVHYSLDAYHAAAKETGQAMGANINRALLPPPEWVTMLPPTGLKAVLEDNEDITVSWDQRPGAPGYAWRNLRGDNQQEISSGVTTGNSFVFTRQQQWDAYGAGAGFVTVEVAENNTVTGTLGPAARYEGPVDTSGLLPAPEGLAAVRQTNEDALFSWALRPESKGYEVVNFSAATGDVLWTKVVPEGGSSVLFTRQEQIDAYGFLAGYVRWQVRERRVNGSLGPMTEFAGNVDEGGTVLVPIDAIRAVYVGQKELDPWGGVIPRDIRIEWDAPADGVPYWFVNLNVGTAAPITEGQQAQTFHIFTVQAQRDAYGFPAGNVYANVSKYNAVSGTRGPILEYNGPVTEPA